MATIKEIAKRAGVSTATVSYVINGTKKITSGTALRVNEAIKALDYAPNIVAMNLRKGKTNTIGVLIEDVRCFPTPEILNGIGEAIEGANYQMLVHDLHLYEKIWPNYRKIEDYKDRITKGVQVLRQAMVSGIIYVCMHDREITNLIEPMDIPLIYAYSSCSEEQSFITYDDYSSSKSLVQHLIGLKHQRIGIIGGYSHAFPTQSRLKGARCAMEEQGLILSEEYIRYGDFEYQSGYEAGVQLLGLREPPTAIYVMNDIMAAGCYKACAELGIRIPEDVSIIGFDNRDISKYLHPPLTTIGIPLQGIGRQAWNVLLDSIVDKQQDAQHIILPCEFILRGSLGSAPIR